MKSKGKKRKTAVQRFFSTPPYLFSLMTLIGSLLKPRAPLLHTNTSHIRAYWGPGGATVILAGWRH